MAALATALGATACFSDRGLAIEIDVGSTGATSVELYLGQAACNPENNAAGIDCKAITPPDSMTALRGVVWFRDDDTRYSAAVTGHTATFQLKAGAETELPIVIAVGSTAAAQGTRAVGTATLRDLAIPINSARIVTATLGAAQPVAPGPVDSNGLTEDRVQVWTKQTPSSTCVVVEHWTAGAVARDFVVPAEDPDCDDVVNECNPSAYRGAAPGGMSPVAGCFVDEAPGACVLGSPPCRDDGAPAGGSCGPLRDRVCLPSQFCICSTGPEIDPYPHAGCVRAHLSLAPRVECDVPTMPDGPRMERCDGRDTATIDLDDHYAIGDKCKQPKLVSLASLAPSQLATTASFGGAIMELSNPNQRCRFEISWKSGVHSSLDPQDPPNDAAVIALPGTRGTALVPIVLRFLPNSCATGFECHAMGDPADTVWNCLQ